MRFGNHYRTRPMLRKRTFRLDLPELSKYVDFVATPLYMDYGIVYWLDILANCFRRKLTKPYFIELYAGHPRQPSKHLASAFAVASKYADTVVFSTYQANLARRLQHEMATDPSIRQFFEERGCNEILELLDGWEIKERAESL